MFICTYLLTPRCILSVRACMHACVCVCERERERELERERDFNQTNQRKALPNLYKQVRCPTRDEKTLDHCYCTFPDAYHAVPQAALGRSDHTMVYLIPTYMQKLKSDKRPRKTTRGAKAQYQNKLEKQFSISNSHAVWQGLQQNTQYKQKPTPANNDSTLPDQLNHFYSIVDRTPPKLQATLALSRLCPQTQIQVSDHLPSLSSHGR